MGSVDMTIDLAIAGLVATVTSTSDTLKAQQEVLAVIVPRLLACERWIQASEAKASEVTAHHQSEAITEQDIADSIMAHDAELEAGD